MASRLYIHTDDAGSSGGIQQWVAGREESDLSNRPLEGDGNWDNEIESFLTVC